MSKLSSRRALAGLLVLALAACAGRHRLRPYTTDGCSLSPDGTMKEKDLWLNCCEAHDRRYWTGGTQAQRLGADLDMRACIAATGQPRLVDWMLKGTRVGGGPYVPAGFRWGYGWNYLRGYEPLTSAEEKMIEETEKK